jgi:hypothetical protein
LGRRGPGAGLRQADTVAQARRWLRLFESLAVPQSARLLPHLGLRITDAPVLRDTAAAVAAHLQTDLAQTGAPGRTVVDDVNETLEDAYADMEQRHGARLARAVFALSADGLPGRAEAELMSSWEAALRDAQRNDLAGVALDAEKRDVVVSLIGVYLAAVQPLDAAAAVRGMVWLAGLARWRRFASLCRALGRVLSDDELVRLVKAPTADGARLV